MKPESKNQHLTRGLYHQYLAQRHQEAQERPKEHETWHGKGNGTQKANARAKSDLTAELVGHIRWLRESRGMTCGRIAKLLAMPAVTAGRVERICDYRTWGDIDASRSPNLPQP